MAAINVATGASFPFYGNNNHDAPGGESVAVNNTVSLSTLFVTNALFDPEIWDIPSGNLQVGGPLPTLKGFTSVQNPTLP